MSLPKRVASKSIVILLLLVCLSLEVTSFATNDINSKARHPQREGITTTTIRPFPLAVLKAQSSSSSSSRTTNDDSKKETVDDDRRQPWEPFRFVRQSSKFINMNPLQRPSKRTVAPGDILWRPGNDADSPPSSFQLAPLDDVVMGGVSSSTFDNDTGLWRGSVTDKNNGGFVGIRSTPSVDWNMQQCSGIQLKVKSSISDTLRYKFVVRDSTDFNGISWTTSINVGSGGGSNDSVLKLFSPPPSESSNGNQGGAAAAAGVTTIRIPFDKQVPTLFARTVPDQTFQKDHVVGVQLAYSKFEYDGDLNPNFALGEMSLQIIEMSAY